MTDRPSGIPIPVHMIRDMNRMASSVSTSEIATASQLNGQGEHNEGASHAGGYKPPASYSAAEDLADLRAALEHASEDHDYTRALPIYIRLKRYLNW